MYFHKEGFPEENELVLCTVTSVQYNSVFCNLDHYGKSGMIHISEVAPGRIRNIRDYVQERKKVVCKVLQVNLDRGHIDLSLRRVNDSQRRSFNMLIKQEQKAEKIIENLASELKEEPEKLYKVISSPILKEYEFLHMAFQEHVEGEANLLDFDIPKKYLEPLVARVVEKIKPKSVTISGALMLKSYASDGIEVIKRALKSAQEEVGSQLSISYLGSGKYKLVVTADEYPEAETLLKSAVDKAASIVEEGDGEADFERT